jgi:hypothetical protein
MVQGGLGEGIEEAGKKCVNVSRSNLRGNEQVGKVREGRTGRQKQMQDSTLVPPLVGTLPALHRTCARSGEAVNKDVSVEKGRRTWWARKRLRRR